MTDQPSDSDPRADFNFADSELPELVKVRVDPGDVVLLRYSETVAPPQMMGTQIMLDSMFEGAKILVLDGRSQLEVLSPAKLNEIGYYRKGPARRLIEAVIHHLLP